MVKLKLKNSRVKTRGTRASNLRDETTVRIFREHGRTAKLVDAHGSLVKANKPAFEIVPQNTVIIFLSEVGYCADVVIMRKLQNEYFRTGVGIEKFLMGDAARRGLHYGNAYERTYLPGESYPSISLQFWDARLAGMGWVWKLPLGRKRMEATPSSELGPNKSEVYSSTTSILNRRQSSDVLLKDVIKEIGSGVYIIASCLVATEQIQPSFPAGRLPMSLPASMKPATYWAKSIGWKRIAPQRTRSTIRIGLHKATGKTPGPSVIKRIPRPGTKIRTHVPFLTSIPETRKRRINLDTALKRMSRAPNRVNLNTIIPHLNANVNIPKLRRTLKYLQNPNNFFLEHFNSNSTNASNFYNISNINRGAYIHSRI